jgi:hypothetical protein
VVHHPPPWPKRVVVAPSDAGSWAGGTPRPTVSYLSREGVSVSGDALIGIGACVFCDVVG